MKSRQHKGNKSAQNRRRRKRLKTLPERQKFLHELIDGNMTYYPVAYCKIHGAWLSQGLIETHRCAYRHCRGFEKMEKKGVLQDGKNDSKTAKVL